MDIARSTVAFYFLLLFLLVILVYYIGFQTDVGAVSGAINQLSLTGTGRTASGQFAPYPSGGK